MTIMAKYVYEAYPDSDLLCTREPKDRETAQSFARDASDAGDSLWMFCIREAAEDTLTPIEYCQRLKQGIEDLQAVINYFEDRSAVEICPRCGYTLDDCATHLDHYRCESYPFFDCEKDTDGH